ncbi:MAG: TrmB family transcriptional regulator [Candidatus Aenigmarchaeota archaeon]|nr:TrmB family transcriptional regulator [Candidatus Aenigmarchaeota archaeon]
MEENILNALKTFGLTDYEAKVYYAVCVSETSSATDLSKLSKVPRARIYDILSTLARKGWVNILEERPVRYKPTNFNIIKKKLEEEENKLKKAKTEILEEIEAHSKKDKDVISEAAQELISGKEDVLKLIKTFISKAKSEITLNYVSTFLLDKLIPDLEYAKRKKIKIKIILSSNQKVPALRTLKKISEVNRGIKEPTHGNLLVDKKYYANLFETKDNIHAVAIYYKKCIFCLSAWLNREWEESRKI